MSEKELAEKALTDNRIEVHVTLYEPFYNFMKEYLAFFGDKRTIEQLCRDMIYNDVNYLYQELTGFASESTHHVEEGSLFEKWPHLAITSYPDPEPEESDC